MQFTMELFCFVYFVLLSEELSVLGIQLKDKSGIKWNDGGISGRNTQSAITLWQPA